MDITEAIRKIKAGEDSQEVWEVVVVESETIVWPLCIKWFGVENAKDAVQEVLFRVWRRVSTIEDPKTFRKWVSSVARNSCVEMIRREVRRRKLLEQAGPLEISSTLADPEELLAEREAADIRKHLLSPESPLTPVEKSVMALKMTGLYTERKIAERLGRPLNEVRGAVSSARRKLRKKGVWGYE